MSNPHEEQRTRVQLMQDVLDSCVTALLAVEWKGEDNRGDYATCPLCDEPAESSVLDFHKGHAHDCLIDQALTKAGLPDQASRDAARKALP